MFNSTQSKSFGPTEMTHQNPPVAPKNQNLEAQSASGSDIPVSNSNDNPQANNAFNCAIL